MPNNFDIPAGTKNLKQIFPSLDWDNIKSYNVEVTNGTDTIATTPEIIVGCCPDDVIRLYFLNDLGRWDAINFYKPKIIHEDSADEYQNALSYPLLKTDTGIERFNVKSNDTYEAKINCNEIDMPYLRECWDSPKIFLDWTGIEGQADDYIPVVKISGKFELLKNVDEFRYEFIIQFKLSNEYITIRN